MTTPIYTNPPRVMILEGQTVPNASTRFVKTPCKFRGDEVIAVEDERADGGVMVAGFDADTNAPWAGILFTNRNPGVVLGHGQETEHGPEDEAPPPREIEQEQRESQQAEGESKQQEQQQKKDDNQQQGEGECEGEPDPLLALIHGIAAGRDTIVMEELGVAMVSKLSGDLEDRMRDLQEMVNAKLTSIAEKGLESRTVIEVKGLPPVALDKGELVHMELTRVLALIASGAKNILLVGPAGCGKTTLAKQVAKALGHERFAALSCSPGMSEAKVLGRIGSPTPTNPTGYHQTAIIDVFRNGGTILFDEMDNADASMMVSFNAMTDGGFATLPTGEVVPRAENSVIIGAMNTFGHGADRLYVGRNQLDAATLDRFVGATVEMDYDKDLERKLCPENEIRNAVWELRGKARKHNLRRVVSTRSLVAARRLCLGMKETLPLVLKRLTLGWSPQDRAAVGVGVSG